MYVSVHLNIGDTITKAKYMTNLTTQLKTGTEPVLNELNIKTVYALEMYLTQIYLANAFPIELKKAANNAED
ncbi:MAG: hypothetical protein QG651_892 [Pseudomonadota bacterium]|jgi:antitoxin component of RelBE/YafQ-DinJ toxin-antitoxin module|nr:hypothetical protein [Pseudomonadota bacterium]